MNPLKNFYDSPERDVVREFLLDVLKERAVEKVFTKQAIAGVYEAKKVIDDAFDKLDELYKPKVERKVETSR